MALKSDPAVPASTVASKAAWHRSQAKLPVQEKFRILLKLQAQDLPLIQRRRAMQPWERPWAIEP